ncbi:MAG: hypothetical protein PHN73_08405 [Eubacteriales bacterium]|nr:hypothetical protein [Eubacteriales bacterium]
MIVYLDVYSKYSDEIDDCDDMCLEYSKSFAVNEANQFDDIFMNLMTEKLDIWTYEKNIVENKDTCLYKFVVFGKFTSVDVLNNYLEKSFTVVESSNIIDHSNEHAENYIVYDIENIDEIREILSKNGIDVEVTTIFSRYSCGADTESFHAILKIALEYLPLAISLLLAVNDLKERLKRVDKSKEALCKNTVQRMFNEKTNSLWLINFYTNKNGLSTAVYRSRYSQYTIKIDSEMKIVSAKRGPVKIEF